MVKGESQSHRRSVLIGGRFPDAECAVHSPFRSGKLSFGCRLVAGSSRPQDVVLERRFGAMCDREFARADRLLKAVQRTLAPCPGDVPRSPDDVHRDSRCGHRTKRNVHTIGKLRRQGVPPSRQRHHALRLTISEVDMVRVVWDGCMFGHRADVDEQVMMPGERR